MKTLVINGKEMYEPAEANGQKKEEAKAKAAKPANKARKAENK